RIEQTDGRRRPVVSYEPSTYPCPKDASCMLRGFAPLPLSFLVDFLHDGVEVRIVCHAAGRSPNPFSPGFGSERNRRHLDAHLLPVLQPPIPCQLNGPSVDFVLQRSYRVILSPICPAWWTQSNPPDRDRKPY